jgi:hypothetical protein
MMLSFPCVELACGDLSGAISFDFQSFPCAMYVLFIKCIATVVAHLCCDDDTAELLAS